MKPIATGSVSREARRCGILASAALLAAAPLRAASGFAVGAHPVRIGLDLEIADRTSTADDAIAAGARVAVREVNEAGGVLGGRPLELVVRDNRGLPARGIDNAHEFASTPDLVAYLCGKYSAIALAQLPLLHREQLILLDPWAAADAIIDHAHEPSYTFRLSLRDGWAASALLAEAQRRGFRRVALLVPRNLWGRSFEHTVAIAEERFPSVRIVEALRYDWAVVDVDLAHQLGRIRRAEPDALLMVANEAEGARIIDQVLANAALRRLPILSHWGILGGPIHRMVSVPLGRLDLSVVGTIDLSQPAPRPGEALEAGAAMLGAASASRIPSVFGFVHAYDLVRLLARAVELAGSTSRARVREALEHLPAWTGLTRHYQRPFTPVRHEALGPRDVKIFAVDADGTLRQRAAGA